MINRKTVLFLSTAMSVGLAICASAVSAQTAPQQAEQEATAADPGDIVVTAQFKSQRLQDTPISISAVSGADLERRGLADVAGAASLAPNVSLTKGNGVGGSFGQFASVFIRGVGQGDIHFAVEPGVGMYVDDVYYGVMSGAVFQLMDTDRVEVLRGPQGTLAGKNSLGGSIKVFSKRPGPETDGYVEAAYGGRNLLSGRAAANFTIVEDKLFARIAISGRRRDGYLTRLDYACVTGNYANGTQRKGDDCKLGTQGGEAVWTAKASFLWKPVAGVENLFIIDSVQDTSENSPIKLFSQSALWAGMNNYITGPTDYTNYENYVVRPTGPLSSPTSYSLEDRSTLNGKGLTNTLTVDVADDIELTSITGYKKSKVRLMATSDASPASLTDQVWNLDHNQFTQELRLSGKMPLLDWTVGGFYYKANGVSHGRVTIPGGNQVGGGGTNLDTIFRDPVSAFSLSAFAHIDWHPIDGLDVITAIRFTKDGKDFTFNRYNYLGQPHPQLSSLVGATNSYRGENVDYRLGLSYKWTPDILTYAQYSTGFKGGGVNPRPFFASQVVPFAPEHLKAWEVGVKAQLFDRKLTINSAAFINQYDDLQGQVGTCNDISPFPGAPCSAIRTIGNAEVKGLEIETTLRPIAGLTLTGSAGYLDFKYKSVTAASGITIDMTAAYNPKWTANFSAQYKIDIGAAGSVSPRVDYSYRSNLQAATINRPLAVIDALDLWNAGLDWDDRDGDWSVRLAVSNLFDKFYYESKLAPTAPAFIGSGRVGPPRQWSITVKRSF